MENDKQKIKLEELEKRVNSLAKKIQTNVYAIGEMDSLVNKLVENASYSDYDRFIYPCTRKGIEKVVLDVFQFLCKPRFMTKLVIKTKVYFNGINEIGGTLKFIWDQYNSVNPTGEIIKEYSGITGEFSDEIVIEKTFFSTKGNYCFRLWLDSTATSLNDGCCGIEFVDVSLYGVNVEILNRDLDLKVFHGGHYYYITQTTTDGYYYAKGSAFNFKKLSELNFKKVGKLIPNTEAYTINNLEAFNVTYIPNISCDSLQAYYKVKTDDEGSFAFVTDYTYSIYEGVNNPTDGSYLSSAGTIGGNYSVAPPTSLVRQGSKLLTYSSVHTGTCYAHTSTPTDNGAAYSSRQLKINGVNWEEKCVEASTVVAKDWMYRAKLRPNCYFYVNYLGEIYFFYGYNSSGKIEIGIGHQVNAYMQSDRSITVYFTYMRNVYKRVLYYDSTTDSYSLDTSVLIMQGTREYIEGKTTDYFVKTDSWSYYHK